MGFEIKYMYHPRKEEGGYNTEVQKDKTIKVGKPFDDTTLDKCAAAIMSQLARRDIWVVDVEVSELVKKQINFKESADGKGIILKNKRFSLSQTAEMISGVEIIEEPVIPEGMQPHEVMQRSTQTDDLYNNPNRAAPVRRSDPNASETDQSKVLYQVHFDPEIVYVNEIRNLGLKFTEDKKYSVHRVVPSPTGRLDAQKIVVTDDTGRVITVDEKFFTSAGRGLMLDKQLGFSGDNQRGARKPRLVFESELITNAPSQMQIPEGMENVPVDDGSLTEESLVVPDIRGE